MEMESFSSSWIMALYGGEEKCLREFLAGQFNESIWNEQLMELEFLKLKVECML